MAQLAIKGHATRGKEVIEILEMLGGKIRCDRLAGNEVFSWYYINGNGYIDYKHYSLFYDTTVFILETFLEKYPYKVGDKVIVTGLPEYPKSINFMKWFDGNIHYSFDNETWFLPSALNIYKEETMEIKPNQIKDKNAFIDIANTEYNNVNTIELLCSDMFDVEIIHEDKIVLKRKKPQYPKTYEECCGVLKIEYPYFKTEEDGISASTYKNKLFGALKQLLICRDAYWKIAGEQMKLGKPWEPIYTDDTIKYSITTHKNRLDFNDTIERNYVLIFPTKEIRHDFYENFKDLIEACKELL